MMHIKITQARIIDDDATRLSLCNRSSSLSQLLFFHSSVAQYVQGSKDQVSAQFQQLNDVLLVSVITKQRRRVKRRLELCFPRLVCFLRVIEPGASLSSLLDCLLAADGCCCCCYSPRFNRRDTVIHTDRDRGHLLTGRLQRDWVRMRALFPGDLHGRLLIETSATPGRAPAADGRSYLPITTARSVL